MPADQVTGMLVVKQAGLEGANMDRSGSAERRRTGRIGAAAILMASLLLAAAPVAASHAGPIDQEQTDWELGGSCFNGIEPARLAQGVNPSADAWAQVDLSLRVSPAGPGSVVTLNVRDDGIDGPIIGSSSTVLPSGFAFQWISFHFDPSVPLTPGTPVFLELRLQALTGSWGFSEADPYAGGSAWANCLPGIVAEHPARDFAFVTYAPSDDGDGDGLPDAVDPDTIGAVVEGLPGDALSDGHRTAMLARLESIEASVASGDSAEAITQLENLRRRVDGCGTTAGMDDWIVDCPSQLIVRGMIDDMITALGG
jgi:hypothetical protein